MERTAIASLQSERDRRPAEAPASLSGALAVAVQPDPESLIASCANCGARMLDRKCKLICDCGYFLSCSDYY